jgi:hypothetical protein
MRIEYYPSLDNGSPWWIGCAINNRSQYDHIVRIGYDNENLFQIHSIGQFSNYVIGIPHNSRCDLSIWLPDGCYSQVNQGWIYKDGNQGLTDKQLNMREITTFQEIIQPIGKDWISTWDNETTFSFGGKHECSMVYNDVKNIIELFAWQSYSLWPDRYDRLINIGDSGSLTTCQGHDGAHDGLEAIDFDYFTYITNVTQYGDNPTSIWKNGEVDLDVFDAERTAWWWAKCKKAFPRGQVISHSKIIAAIKKLQPTIYEEIKYYLQAYNGGKHAYHWHLTLDRQSNGYPMIDWKESI